MKATAAAVKRIMGKTGGWGTFKAKLHALGELPMKADGSGYVDVPENWQHAWVRAYRPGFLPTFEKSLAYIKQNVKGA